MRGTTFVALRALAVVAALVALAAAAVALSGARGRTPPTVPTGVAAANALFAGVPQHGLRLGNASAPVTVVEYFDLQCPSCEESETQALPAVIARYVRTGKAKLVARPLAFVGAGSVRGRDALLAAARQDRAFVFADLLYRNQGGENEGWLDDRLIAKAAGSIPRLDVQALLDDRGSAAVAAAAARIDSLAAAGHVSATPTFVVGGSRGDDATILVAPSKASLIAAVDAALHR